MPDVKLGTVDRSVLVFIPDPASTDGSGKTGLVAANLTVSYTRVETDNDVVVTDVTSSLSNLSALTDAHADWGLKEVSSTLAPGLYRLDIADAVFASGAWYAVVYVMITSSAAAASPILFTLIAFDPLDAVRFGLAALSPIATVTSAVNDGAASATVFITDLTESANDYWKDAFLRITSGALINQVKKITAYDGTTKAITVASPGFTAAPGDNVTFEIVND